MIQTYISTARPNLQLTLRPIKKATRSFFAAALVALLFGLVPISAAFAAGEAKTESKVETKTESKPAAKATAKPVAKKDEKLKPGDKKMTTIIIETSLGNIEAELNAEKAPLSEANFMRYVDKKHYDGLIFHRVISGFMIQGGGMDEKMNERKNEAAIKNEATNGLKNERGTLAMARTGVVDSATSQFFINTVDNEFLNHSSPDPRGYGYAVFGKVTAGMDVVDKIRAVPTGTTNGMQDVPKTPVVIKSIKRK